MDINNAYHKRVSPKVLNGGRSKLVHKKAIYKAMLSIPISTRAFRMPSFLASKADKIQLAELTPADNKK